MVWLLLLGFWDLTLMGLLILYEQILVGKSIPIFNVYVPILSQTCGLSIIRTPTIDKVIFWIMLERVFFSIKRFPAKMEGISEKLLPFPLLLYHLTSACYSHLGVRESLFSKYTTVSIKEGFNLIEVHKWGGRVTHFCQLFCIFAPI